MPKKLDLESPEHIQFLRDYLFLPVQDLVGQYGDDEVEEALIELLPGYEPSVKLDETRGRARLIQTLLGGGATGARMGGKAIKGLTKWTMKGAGGLGKGLLGLGGLALGGLTGFAGKNIDQDVEIDGVSTDDALNVTPKGDILKLITQSNKLLQAITQLLGANTRELEGMDDNFDDLISIQTGLSKAGVKGRQATGAGVDAKLDGPYPGLSSIGTGKEKEDSDAKDAKEPAKKPDTKK